ncbi:MAG: hypothetical protein NTW94_05665 [Legionellales bacterium]|nr:hypothetical protein [Legionellales bacterium]
MISKPMGIGLVELMIALLLGSFILLGLTQHYLAIKQQVQQVQKALEQDIDLILVSDLVRESVRMAGFTPCSSSDHLVTEPKIVSLEVRPSKILIRRMSERFDEVYDIPKTDLILASHREKYHQDDTIMVADCYHAEVQTIRHIEPMGVQQRITLKTSLHFTYHDAIYIGAWMEESFEIHKHAGGASLFYKSTSGTLLPSRGEGNKEENKLFGGPNADELTQEVQSLSAKQDVMQGRKIVHLALGLMNAQPWMLDTSVRTP